MSKTYAQKQLEPFLVCGCINTKRRTPIQANYTVLESFCLQYSNLMLYSSVNNSQPCPIENAGIYFVHNLCLYMSTYTQNRYKYSDIPLRHTNVPCKNTFSTCLHKNQLPELRAPGPWQGESPVLLTSISQKVLLDSYLIKKKTLEMMHVYHLRFKGTSHLITLYDNIDTPWQGEGLFETNQQNSDCSCLFLTISSCLMQIHFKIVFSWINSMTNVCFVTYVTSCGKYLYPALPI